ncbi:hypothetical protein MAR_027022 [Mya arenaria]|uniref:Secreted protein n=1 Tax=Mya arenaria TaxID=6604 RepID=A0ABY7EUD4_MYAAR|nr:hypothetical protein MAR_027022 [Mya arenaria]
MQDHHHLILCLCITLHVGIFNVQPQTASQLDSLFLKEFSYQSIIKRKRFAIVRFPCFSVCNDDYYFTFLLLLLPHHSEIDLVCKYGCAKDAFSAKHSLLDFSMDMHNTFLLQA